MPNYSIYRNKIKLYTASFGISSIIFLWSIQVSVHGATVPLYFLFSALLVLFSGFRQIDLFKALLLSSLLFALLVLQILFGSCLVTPLRSLAGIPMLAFMLAIVLRWVFIIEFYKGYYFLFKVVKFFIIIQFVYQIIQIVLWFAGYYQTPYLHYSGIIPRASGFFPEPSHLAVSLSPFIYICIFQNKFADYFLGKVRYILLVILILCPSTTLMGILGLVILINILKRKRNFTSLVKSTVFCFFGVLIFVFIITKVPSVSERIITLLKILLAQSKADAGMHPSALLYIKGLQMALYGLKNYPLGVGMLNMQFLNKYSSISMLNEFFYRQNSFDGTSMLFKIICEYGYFGIFVIFYLLWKLLVKRDRKTTGEIVKKMFIFALFASFVRGGSYFDAPLLGLAIIYEKLLPVYFIKKFFFKDLLVVDVVNYGSENQI